MGLISFLIQDILFDRAISYHSLTISITRLLTINKRIFMKVHHAFLVIALITSAQSHTGQNLKDEAAIQKQVDMILEWAKTEKEINDDAAFEKKLESSPLINPTKKDTAIIREAKKRAKAQLIQLKLKTDTPTDSYWQMYAPQFMQDTASATSDYIASWIPNRIKNAVNKMSTKTKIALATTAIASLAALYHRDALIKMLFSNQTPQSPFLTEEEKKELGIFPTKTVERKEINDPKRLEQLQKTSKPYVSILKKLNQPLANPIEEKKAQEIANKIVAAVTTDGAYSSPLAGFGIIDESREGSIDNYRDEFGNAIEGYAQNYTPTVTERARFKALQELKKEHPEYVELDIVERYLKKDNSKQKISRAINAKPEK